MELFPKHSSDAMRQLWEIVEFEKYKHLYTPEERKIILKRMKDGN